MIQDKNTDFKQLYISKQVQRIKLNMHLKNRIKVNILIWCARKLKRYYLCSWFYFDELVIMQIVEVHFYKVIPYSKKVTEFME